ncbi:amidohydrolase family protein [Nocardioides nitrophenolicus]|uniref:amidohydrolase family protein n=1 Tax=Nocardioides nitrophenolicus TaxID=60489 RepID=UPI00195EE160|nr:amidohydrolase family protein [Nocardioides nitrophenolicus]MBM7519564.1 imidazolonepropionase-like amidohydrolase [Nocardioides nitrophenolicus]
MSALRFSGPVLPDGEPREVYVVDGRVTYERPPGLVGAETAGEGWIVPGLVDAHNHLGLADGGAVDDAEIERTAVADRDNGVLLTRDCGSPADTRWVQDREDLPRLIRCGRHVARTRRYLRNYAQEVEPDGLADAVAEQAAAGDGWVKLVGDWISREEGDLAPSFPADAVAAAIGVAHAQGAKVTAHCFGADSLGPLLDAGIDCIEHGTGLSEAHLARMVDQGVALVPTVLQTSKFPEFVAAAQGKFPAYGATMEALFRTRREVLMAAYDAGVAMYVGSDGGGSARHGVLHEEILAMAAMGLPNEYVLGAASWRGRAWLGWNPGLDEGDPADFVIYPRNPVEDLSVLTEPSRVVLRGRVVA